MERQLVRTLTQWPLRQRLPACRDAPEATLTDSAVTSFRNPEVDHTEPTLRILTHKIIPLFHAEGTHYSQEEQHGVLHSTRTVAPGLPPWLSPGLSADNPLTEQAPCTPRTSVIKSHRISCQPTEGHGRQNFVMKAVIPCSDHGVARTDKSRVSSRVLQQNAVVISRYPAGRKARTARF